MLKNALVFKDDTVQKNVFVDSISLSYDHITKVSEGNGVTLVSSCHVTCDLFCTDRDTVSYLYKKYFVSGDYLPVLFFGSEYRLVLIDTNIFDQGSSFRNVFSASLYPAED